MKLRLPVGRDTLREDAVAGLVLGVESVPDGLAAGLLAGVSPLSGLYAYLFGTIGGSFFTSSVFMAVQATGAMAIIVADVPAVHTGDNQARALFTLSVLTGVVMLAAVGSKLVIVSASEHIQEQLRVTGVTDLIAPRTSTSAMSGWAPL